MFSNSVSGTKKTEEIYAMFLYTNKAISDDKFERSVEFNENWNMYTNVNKLWNIKFHEKPLREFRVDAYRQRRACRSYYGHFLQL
jgi:hypothetical protein